MFTVFTRRWWKEATTPGWPNNLEPHPRARRTILGRVQTEQEALAMCERYNTFNKPGRYSRKAEYTSQY